VFGRPIGLTVMAKSLETLYYAYKEMFYVILVLKATATIQNKQTDYSFGRFTLYRNTVHKINTFYYL